MKTRTSLAAILMCAALAPSASAFSHRYMPLPQAVAHAEAIAIVQPLKILGNRRANVGATVQIEVTDALKGNIAKGKVWVQLDAAHSKALGRLDIKRKWVFFLKPSGESPAWNVMLDGTAPYSPATVSEIKTILK